MTTQQLLLVILIISVVLTIIFGRALLRSDNNFYYRNGRAMRAWDILFAIDKSKFNYRLQNMSEETLSLLRKWILLDVRFAPLAHLSVALLLYFSSLAYAREGYRLLFDVLIGLQAVALISHIITDIMLSGSLKSLEMQQSMRFFNANVFMKLAFPMAGCFVSFATAILVWFRYLNSFDLPIASLLFIAPVVLIVVTINISKRFKSQPVKTN